MGTREVIFVYRLFLAAVLIAVAGAGVFPATAVEREKIDACLITLYNYPAEVPAANLERRISLVVARENKSKKPVPLRIPMAN